MLMFIPWNNDENNKDPPNKAVVVILTSIAIALAIGCLAFLVEAMR
jgi:hypothetical protein